MFLSLSSMERSVDVLFSEWHSKSGYWAFAVYKHWSALPNPLFDVFHLANFHLNFYSRVFHGPYTETSVYIVIGCIMLSYSDCHSKDYIPHIAVLFRGDIQTYMPKQLLRVVDYYALTDLKFFGF